MPWNLLAFVLWASCLRLLRSWTYRCAAVSLDEAQISCKNLFVLRFLPHNLIFIYIDFLCKTTVLVEMGHRTWQDDEFVWSITKISPWVGASDLWRVLGSMNLLVQETGEEWGVKIRQGRSWRGCTAGSYRSGLGTIQWETWSQDGSIPRAVLWETQVLTDLHLRICFCMCFAHSLLTCYFFFKLFVI